MGSNQSGWMVVGALALALASPISAQPVSRDRCDLVDLTNRLRWAHPIGATRADGRQCLNQTMSWVRTAPMEGRERLAWRRSVGALMGSDDAACRQAAATLVWLERVGVVSVWAPADTAAGMVNFGASYLTEATAPLAIQFWVRAFDRPVQWLAGALAHEAFHVLRPEAAEREALAFGEACGRRLGRPAIGPDELTENASRIP